MKAIAILNLKGGVGKTVTAINMASILAMDHKKHVVLIDCDSQCNATEFMLGRKAEDDLVTLADVMLGNGEPVWSDNTVPTEWGVELLPGSDELMGLDVRKIGEEIKPTCLADFCGAMREDGDVDFVIFDCPPAFNAASAAALYAADEVIVPIKLDAFSLRGLANIQAQVDNMRKINPTLVFAGALITMWRSENVVIEAEALLRESGLIPVFDTVIRRTAKVDESTFEREPVHVYSPRSSAGCDYRSLVREYLGGARRG